MSKNFSLMVAGAIASVAHLFGPVHELGHILIGGGWISSWTSSYLLNRTPGALYFGYGFELVVFGVVLLLAYKSLPVMAFCLGYIGALVYQPYISTDFHAIGEYREAMLEVWRLHWALTFLSSLGLFVLRSRKSTDRSPSSTGKEETRRP